METGLVDLGRMGLNLAIKKTSSSTAAIPTIRTRSGVMSGGERSLRQDGPHRTLFTGWDDVEEAWKFVQPVLKEWASAPEDPGFPNYAAGEWGPEDAETLLGRDGRAWYDGRTRWSSRACGWQTSPPGATSSSLHFSSSSEPTPRPPECTSSKGFQDGDSKRRNG